jgi:threonylcarbamoyladenosine tRNA methylthiotransferase MtaB
MPQLPRAVIKERAQRLRQKGEGALRKHLEGEIGRTARVLTESPMIARTEQFTPVRLSSSVAPGTMTDVRIAGHDGHRLIAAAPLPC